MFIEASSPVPLPIGRARSALLAALADGAVLQESADLYGDGVTAEYGVGPRGISKRVRARSLAATDVGGLMVVPIRWEATGVGGQLFPTLEAAIAVVPVNDVTSAVSIAGRYAVPLGRVGDALDRAALAGVAQRTLDLFVQKLAKRMLAHRDADLVGARAS